jgi:hypothetical protein
MKTFKQHLTEGIGKRSAGPHHGPSHGTGTIRNDKLTALTTKEGWIPCTHTCKGLSTVTKYKPKHNSKGIPYEVEQEHGDWSHKRPPNQECHLPKNSLCEKCLTYDLMSPIAK